MFYNCKEATLAAARKEEEAISSREKFLLAIHLLYCKFCRRFVQQSRLLKQSLQGFDKKNEAGEHLLSFSADREMTIKAAITDELKKGS